MGPKGCGSKSRKSCRNHESKYSKSQLLKTTTTYLNALYNIFICTISSRFQYGNAVCTIFEGRESRLSIAFRLARDFTIVHFASSIFRMPLVLVHHLYQCTVCAIWLCLHVYHNKPANMCYFDRVSTVVLHLKKLSATRTWTLKSYTRLECKLNLSDPFKISADSIEVTCQHLNIQAT